MHDRDFGVNILSNMTQRRPEVDLIQIPLFPESSEIANILLVSSKSKEFLFIFFNVALNRSFAPVSYITNILAAR